MVTLWYCQESFGCVGLPPCVVWADPDVRNWEKNEPKAETELWKMNIPESMAVIVRISLLHLNSGLEMSIFAN